MEAVPRIATMLVTVVLGVGLGLLGKVIDPEGLLWFGAFIVGMVLISLTDRRRFGWIE